MTLLSICNNAVADTSFAQVTQVFGNPSQTATALLACARRAVKDLIRHNNGGWTPLISEYDFTTNAATITGDITQGSTHIANIPDTSPLDATGTFTYVGGAFPPNSEVAVDSVNSAHMPSPALYTSVGETLVFGQSGYPLPSDFGNFIDDTMWDRTRFWRMRGPMSPQQWQMYKSSAIGKSSIQRRWRLKKPVNATLGFTFFFIDPVPTDIGSQLVFEYLSNAPIVNYATSSSKTDWALDTDNCKLDEYVIELGVKYRMLRRFGYDYSVELDEWERACDVYAATDGGLPILSLAPESDLTLLGPWNVPESGYGS